MCQAQNNISAKNHERCIEAKPLQSSIIFCFSCFLSKGVVILMKMFSNNFRLFETFSNPGSSVIRWKTIDREVLQTFSLIYSKITKQNIAHWELFCHSKSSDILCWKYWCINHTCLFSCLYLWYITTSILPCYRTQHCGPG